MDRGCEQAEAPNRRRRAVSRAASHGAKKMARCRLGIHRSESQGEILSVDRTGSAAADLRAVALVAIHRGGGIRPRGGGEPVSDADRPGFRRAFRLPFSRARNECALDDELRFHIDGRIREFIESGLSREDAEAEARLRFGDYDAYRQQTRS